MEFYWTKGEMVNKKLWRQVIRRKRQPYICLTKPTIKYNISDNYSSRFNNRWTKVQMELISGNSALVSSIKDWYALDIGFSSRYRSCGVFRTDTGKTISMFYGDIAKDIVDFANGKKRVGLIIEAPLSFSFDSKGNPCGRSFEKQGTNTRYWFAGLGCAVMSAALFLLRQLYQDQAAGEILLFEGFVSFKGSLTSHEADARILFEKRHTVLGSDRIRSAQTSSLAGIISLFGGTSKPPGVIICRE
jgi:hypothetical protein